MPVRVDWWQLLGDDVDQVAYEEVNLQHFQLKLHSNKKRFVDRVIQDSLLNWYIGLESYSDYSG
jgi:hypothetical protein